MTALGAMITALVAAAVGSLAIPIVAAGIFAGGATWAVGDHSRGKSVVLAALVGGAVMLLSATIAATLGTLGSGTP